MALFLGRFAIFTRIAHFVLVIRWNFKPNYAWLCYCYGLNAINSILFQYFGLVLLKNSYFSVLFTELVGGCSVGLECIYMTLLLQMRLCAVCRRSNKRIQLSSK
jgi:hypothetical protein